jgi:peptidoglycan/xylan/chitin deacetylase (PgdA/CDA1 family)
MRSLPASTGFLVIAALGATVGIAAVASAPTPAWAQDCPGNPDALGTARVLTLEPDTLKRVGVMQYPQSLSLADKEVVLTFDDGPLPRYSNAILDILAAQCVKATYFLVGTMARAYPDVVRRIYEAGHTIGTHSEDHPSRFERLPVAKLRWEIDQGIADVGAALGDPKELAPFFRFPGLGRSDAAEQELAARSLIVFSSDTVADDWYRIKPSEIVRRAMMRLEARGKGILLLHDIHPVTVEALPELLKKLKEAGFHVVHVIPGAGDRIEIASDSAAANQDDSTWPKAAALQAEDRTELPVPDVNGFAADYRSWRVVALADGSASLRYLALAAVTQWADPHAVLVNSGEPEFPVPAIIEFLDGGAFRDVAAPDKPRVAVSVPAGDAETSVNQAPVTVPVSAGKGEAPVYEFPASGLSASTGDAETPSNEPHPAPAAPY